MEFNIHQLDPHLMDAKTSSVVIFVDILPALTLELRLVNPMLHPGIVDVGSRVVGCVLTLYQSVFWHFACWQHISSNHLSMTGINIFSCNNEITNS